MTTRTKLTPEAVLGFKNVADAQVSSDGKIVAFVVGDQFITDTKLPRSNLWAVSSDTGDLKQLTSGPRADTTPRWSPDGQTLAFLSDRDEDGQRQILLLPTSGGEAVPLTQIEGAVPSHRGLNPMSWSPDGKKIAFLKADPESPEEKRRKQEKDDYIDFEREPRYTRLYTVDVETGSVICVSPNGLQIWEACWSSSGDEFAVVASDLPFEHSWYGCRLVRLSGIGESARTLYDVRRQVAKPTWSPDGSLIGFLSSSWSDRSSVAGGVFVVSPDGGEARELSVHHGASATWLDWTDDSRRLVATAHDRGSFSVAEIDVASADRRVLWRGDAVFAEQSWAQFSRDLAGNIAVVREDDENPRDVWLARLQPDGLYWKQLTRLHDHVDGLEIGEVETVRWEGADGWEMQGLLIRPPGSAPGERCPMVVVVHGGPTSVHSHQYYAGRGWYQLIAAQGMAVFLPNPRGSTGWGLEFAESNIGDMGGKDWEDIRLGIAHCVESGIADQSRLGIAGWSYGGFMTAWAVTQTDMFKAVMMGAGISDWRSFHGKTSLSEWDVMYYGDADPWETDGPFQRFSPINYVKRVRTPTLIIHGEEDLDVPVEQGHMFYRALRDLGVETQLVVYPREPHGFQEKNHQLDLGRRISEWFARYLVQPG